MRNATSLALLFVLAGHTLACRDKPTAAIPPSPPPPPAPAASELASLGRKQNGYVVCLNQFSDDVRHGQRIWLEQFGEPGPTAAEKRESFASPTLLAPVQACETALAAVKAAPPSLPALEAAGDAYLAALKKVTPLVSEVRDYVDRHRYRDDHWAKGIALHPKLLAAWKEVNDAEQALAIQVDALEDRIQSEELNALERVAGRGLHWHHLKVLIEAKRVVRGMTADLPREAQDDLPSLSEAVQKLESAATELQAYRSKHSGDPRMGQYALANSAVQALVGDAKDFVRLKREKVKLPPPGANPEMLEGHPARVLRAYNALIDASNHLDWRALGA